MQFVFAGIMTFNVHSDDQHTREREEILCMDVLDSQVVCHTHTVHATSCCLLPSPWASEVREERKGGGGMGGGVDGRMG